MLKPVDRVNLLFQGAGEIQIDLFHVKILVIIRDLQEDEIIGLGNDRILPKAGGQQGTADSGNFQEI